MLDELSNTYVYESLLSQIGPFGDVELALKASSIFFYSLMGLPLEGSRKIGFCYGFTIFGVFLPVINSSLFLDS